MVAKTLMNRDKTSQKSTYIRALDEFEISEYPSNTRLIPGVTLAFRVRKSEINL